MGWWSEEGVMGFISSCPVYWYGVEPADWMEDGVEPADGMEDGVEPAVVRTLAGELMLSSVLDIGLKPFGSITIAAILESRPKLSNGILNTALRVALGL